MIKMLQLHGTDNYQVVHQSPLGHQQLQELVTKLQKLKQYDQKIGLLNEVDEIPRLAEWKSIKALAKMKTSALSVVRKYALITSKDWIRRAAQLANWLTPGMEVRTFDKAEKHLALQWLDAGK
ncbi:MAG: STAS/SEC14 domain-containing protein [Bacteroidota bacterium]